MSLHRSDHSLSRQPEEITCPTCAARPGEDCTFAMFGAPARAVHPARYAALDQAAALAVAQTEEASRCP